MRENRDFVVPVNILTTFARAPFSWAARHTTVCLDILLHVGVAVHRPITQMLSYIKCESERVRFVFQVCG